MKRPRLVGPMTDHAAAARKARAAKGAWTLVTVYRGSSAGDAVARGIRTGRIVAYRPVGSYEAYSAIHDNGTAVYARALSPKWDVAPLPKTFTVLVPDHGTQRGYEGVRIREVEISPTCPRCGALRGPARPHTYKHDGTDLTCNTWENSCGHKDMYDAVLAEAVRRAERRHTSARKGPEIKGVVGGRWTAAVDLIAAEIRTSPYLKAEAAARLLVEAGQEAAAVAVRAFVETSPTRWHMSAKSAALCLMDQDASTVDRKEGDA